MISNQYEIAVSVIVPVFKVELFIERCARSLLSQTLKELEIIFIDDCSPDNSVTIINELLREYPDRIPFTRIIRMETNSGSAKVRKKGIVEAKGQYIIHCDGDDWVDADYYERMYLAAIKQNADVVIGDEEMVYSDKIIPINNDELPQKGKEIIKSWYKHVVPLYCHNKLVRRSIYVDNNILPWDNLNMWEDMSLFARILYYAENVTQVHGTYYHYNRCNTGAMTYFYGIKEARQMIQIARNIEIFYSDKFDKKEFQYTINAYKYLAKLNLITDSFSMYKQFRKIFPESNSITEQLDKRAFSSKGYVRFLLVKNGFARIFILIYKLRKFVYQYVK